MDVYVPVGKWNGVSIAGKVIPPASQPLLVVIIVKPHTQ